MVLWDSVTHIQLCKNFPLAATGYKTLEMSESSRLLAWGACAM